MKCSFLVCFFVSIFFVNAADKENCKRCVQTDSCSVYSEMTKQEQRRWVQKHSCQAPEEFIVFKSQGDFICCPDRAEWENENLESSDHTDKINKKVGRLNSHEEDIEHSPSDDDDDEDDFDNNDEYERQSWSHRPYNQMPNGVYRPTGPHNYERPNFNRNYNHPGGHPNSHSSLNNHPINNPNFNTNGNYGINRPNVHEPNYNNRPNFNRGLNTNFNPNPNYNVPNGNYPNYARPGGNIYGNQLNNNGGVGVDQCSSLTSVLPSPQTGCCGREATNDRNFGAQNGYMNRPPNFNQWAPPHSSYPGRYTRDTDTSVPDITLDTRIAGGKETSLTQFPWTVFLKTTFDYGTKKASFNCGGSLISARYVLTAAHCIDEENARVSNIDINLAEYDKRTFPRDCVNVPGEGRKCIDNVVMEAENIIVHPQYDRVRLQNDIALIKLRGNAPYTEYIRPICLPPINVDNPQYSDLRLAVAGWGRNGTVTSQVKQSTVVNLVPQRQCAESYPHLTQKHLCAAGHSGEDTCKGDSGGPLMMLYEGQYYISGVVSGKRADSPCGTNVPSLYTNVYHYIDWINQNVRY